jgi:hypothetical protein
LLLARKSLLRNIVALSVAKNFNTESKLIEEGLIPNIEKKEVKTPSAKAEGFSQDQLSPIRGTQC